MEVSGRAVQLMESSILIGLQMCLSLFHWNHWLLRWVAARYSSWEWIAGYEIMSEPRTKIAPQSEVTIFSFKEFFKIEEKNTSGDSFL